MTIEFRERHTLRHPFQLQVLRSGTLVGHVRRNAAAGVYQYLRGEFNELVFASQDQDLDALKRKIEQTRWSAPRLLPAHLRGDSSRRVRMGVVGDHHPGE